MIFFFKKIIAPYVGPKVGGPHKEPLRGHFCTDTLRILEEFKNPEEIWRASWGLCPQTFVRGIPVVSWGRWGPTPALALWRSHWIVGPELEADLPLRWKDWQFYQRFRTPLWCPRVASCQCKLPLATPSCQLELLDLGVLKHPPSCFHSSFVGIVLHGN